MLQVEVPSCFVGLVLENCQLPFANHGHVILADPSPILFYPISSSEIRCLVDVPGEKVPSISNGEMAKYLKNVIAPQVIIYTYTLIQIDICSVWFGTFVDIGFCFRSLWNFTTHSSLLLKREICGRCQIEACRLRLIQLRELC